ncbi:MAG: PAS domain-containing protein [Myxacorys chilensis ATA2-1-KO14]|nr:PAS domain-containing protein [Myxacorys chilensis ATA2-1-KO14]
MTDRLQRSVPSGSSSSQNTTLGITEADVLMTAALASRPARQPDLAAEIQALQILAQQLTDDPQAMLKTLVGIVLDLTQAGTAGVSLLDAPNGESVFRWVAISAKPNSNGTAGAFANLEQTTTPGDFSLCGTTLRSNQPQLYAYPERYFTYLHHPQCPIVEGLIIPLCVNRQPLGTLWLLSHDEAHRFDLEDQRLMTRLAGFAAAALQSIQQVRQKVEDAPRSQEPAQDAAVALHQSQELSQQIFDSSGDCIKVLDLEGRLLFISRGGQALLCIEDINPCLNTFWTEFWEGADRQAATEAIARAKAGEVCTFQGYCPTMTGQPKWWDCKISPIRGIDGQVERLLCISRDITDRRRSEDKRKQAEENLRASEERFRLFITASSDMIYRMSADWSKMRYLKGKNFLASTETSSHMWLEKYILREDQPQVLTTIREAIRTKSTFELEHRIIRLDGTVGWTFSRAIPLLDAQGEIIEWFGAAGDVTDRKQAEEVIRRSEEKYRTLFESIDEGFCLIEVLFDETGNPNDYRFLEVNPAFEKHTGLVDAIGKTMRELVPQHDAHWFEIYGKIALTGVPARFENRADALGRFYDVYAFRVGEPHDRKVAILFKDISDRKQAEAEREQLLANERHYVHQMQGLTSAALAINSALSVEEVLQVITNQAVSIIGAHQSVTSLTIDQNWAQAINTIHLSDKYAQWRDYNAPTDGTGIYACVCHLNHSMRMTQDELEAHPGWRGFGKEADKHPPMRGWLAAPLVGRDGHNIGLMQLSDKYEGEFTEADESILVQLAQMASVAVENAQLYEAEQQARSTAEAAQEEAQAANRIKDEFLAVLSHELRSPLNPILGWSKLLQNGNLDATRTQHALKTIERNANLQSELIEDLLDVSRILQGKLSLTVSSVNLAVVIRAAMETMRLAAEAKSIQVEARLNPEVGNVSGDATRLQQVIWNLLSNAVKFTPAGGQVTVQLEQVENQAQITLSDTGKGIQPEFVPYVFEYFRQEDGATTRKFGGLGLGLAIVRHLVELHGGTVKAESSGEGQGATFVVRLPLMQTASKANQDERPPEQPLDLNNISILVVDDETDSRELVAFLLEQQGAQVRTAASAHEALIVLTQSTPDVLLSDIGMPDMDGYMLIQQVRTLTPEQGGQMPAIALTAYAGEMNQQQALAAGFQKHLSKPIEPQRLIQIISSLIRSA